ncbi:MAG: hypothetical protein HKN21_12545 [Candidatus Eisenbacteria bacterium]|uniref:DUF3299 domain-containing protein n=1 Tax=Eiseniibacteriota bacterium TaxID=2212470 RepID=A0A7Y2H3C2_UNCEI|nr:hypothetical protein [Candidatus Eisenbacteria bacterium]
MRNTKRKTSILNMALAVAVLAGILTATPGAVPFAWSNATMNYPEPPADAQELPLLKWRTLNRTLYDPRIKMEFPDEVQSFHRQRVRIEGYLMKPLRNQDKEDLWVLGVNPINFHCGPSDMTFLVQMHLPGFSYSEWPDLPVEVTGTFFVSPTPWDYTPIYYLFGESWRPLRRWIQEFPGAEDAERTNYAGDDH